MRINKITASLIVVLIFGGVVVSANADQSATLDNNLRREALVRAAKMMVTEKITVANKTVPFDLQEGGGGVEQFHYPKDMSRETEGTDTADITTAFVASAQLGVPCFECVEGALDDAIGLPFPIKSVAVGDQVEYVVTIDPGGAIDGETKALVIFNIMTSEFEPIVTEAYPTPLLPNILVALEWPNRTIPEFPEGIESANIVVLLINSELQTLATHVGLDAVKIIPSVEE